MASSKKSIFSQGYLEIGNFEDLKQLIVLLNRSFDGIHYRLEAFSTGKNSYLFIEDHSDQDHYECGILQKRGKKVYACGSSVHALVLGAYARYLEKTVQND